MLRRSQQGEILDCIPELGVVERANARASRERRAKEREEHLRRLGMANRDNNPQEFGNEQPFYGGVQGIGIQPQFQGLRHPATRPIGAFDQPNLRESQTGIPTPAITATNFEVKSSLISMAQNQRYNGLPLEDPLDHLDIFERLCRTVKMNGVPEDAIKMILFPFSLGNKASQWEKNVPSDLVSTWEDVKKEFVNKFYPKQKTAKLRNDITSFKQGAHENLYEAWDRLKDYTRKCPHHGVSKENLLCIFYRGALEHYRRSLDTASYGCFANLTAEQGEQLIENLAQSEECYGGDYDRTDRDQHSDNQRYKELNDKLDKLSKVFLANQKAVNYIGGADVEQQRYHERSYDGFQGVQEEVNYLGNQNNYQGGYQNQNRPYNNAYGNVSQQNNAQWGFQGSAQNTAPANFYHGVRPQVQQQPNAYPQAQANEQDDMKSMLKQLMEGQAKAHAELTERFEKIERKFKAHHEQTQAKFDDIYSHLKNLNNQVAHIASTSQRPAGSLPGKPETNPKAYCNAITLRSGKEIASRGDKKIASRDASNEDVVQLEEVRTDESKEVKDSAEPDWSKSESMELLRNYVPPPPYVPKLPFPGCFKKQILAKQKEKFLALMDEVKVTMPLMDVVKDNPTYCKLLKEMLTNKKKMEEGMVMVSYECSSIIEKTLPRKLSDPGSFTLPCSLGSLRFPKSLCDLGSSVNLMPLSVAKKIGVTTFQKCRISLVLADRSVRIPVGIIENLPLRVGEHYIPTDFVVLEMDEEPVDPLILGRPFLATAGALIDCRKGRIGLQLGDSVVNFDIKRRMENPDTSNQCFSNQTLDELEGKTEEELCTANPEKSAPILENEDPVSELKAPKNEIKQQPPDQKGKDKVKQKEGVLATPIDRSQATDRSIPPWRSRRQQLGSIEPATDRSIPSSKNYREHTRSIDPLQIDRSQIKEICENDLDRSILSRSIDPLPNDAERPESSKRSGKRPAGSLTRSLNKKKARMRMQGRPPPLHK